MDNNKVLNARSMQSVEWSGCALESHSVCHADCIYAYTFVYNGDNNKVFTS